MIDTPQPSNYRANIYSKRCLVRATQFRRWYQNCAQFVLPFGVIGRELVLLKRFVAIKRGVSLFFCVVEPILCAILPWCAHLLIREMNSNAHTRDSISKCAVDAVAAHCACISVVSTSSRWLVLFPSFNCKLSINCTQKWYHTTCNQADNYRLLHRTCNVATMLFLIEPTENWNAINWSNWEINQFFLPYFDMTLSFQPSRW